MYGSHGSTSISCIYTHWPRVIGIGDICPELVFKDLPSNLHIQTDKLHYKNQPDHMLGSGTFGQVYRGRYNGTEAAIKEYKFNDDDCVVTSLDVFFNVRQVRMKIFSWLIIRWTKSSSREVYNFFAF